MRLGDDNNCGVNSREQENGDHALFSTDTYEPLQKNAPEFKELAAMQAGFGYRPIMARRDRTRVGARSVMDEFVSGNYFRTFGLEPRSPGSRLQAGNDLRRNAQDCPG